MDDAEVENVDMERQARIMELAQQQQMALQRLDEVVQNQLNLRDIISGRQQEQQPREEEEDPLLLDLPQQEEEEHQQPPPLLPARNHPTRQQRLTHQSERHDGGSRLCSITQIYFIVSAMLALLAVVTSPSNVLFASIRVMSVKQPISPKNMETTKMKESQLQHAVDAIKEGMAAMDSHGNIVERVRKKGEWEAVVAHSKTKHSSSAAEPSNKKSETLTSSSSSQSSPSSWTDTLVNFVGEIREHFYQQYLVLEQLKDFQRALTNFQPTPEASHPSTVAITDTKQPSLSSRWSPWEWMKQKLANDDGTVKTDDSIQQSESKNKSSQSYRRHGNVNNVKLHSLLSPMLRMIDPSLLQPFLSTKEGDGTADTSATGSQGNPPGEAKPPTGHPTFAGIFDKIFTSTPRLIAIANLLLAVTYLLQTTVADIFLGPIFTTTAAGTNPNNPTGNPHLDDHASRRRRAGRERFGGFLLFKLLLISAVLEPDSVDLFILLSWYTLLSFLRSLAHLAGTTANHASQSGESPSRGALRLLVLVLVCDASAAIACVALFYSTGWNMVLLLTCDCVLLGIDAVAHIVRHGVATMEELHRMEVSLLEERQVELHSQRRERMRDSDAIDSALDDEMMDDENDEGSRERSNVEETEAEAESTEENDLALEGELRQIDRTVEIGEAAHTRRMSTMDTVIFSLEIFALLVTISHFLHIWALHGTSFGLVDGVLALHLHSTISMIGKKIAERRNAHRISRELNSNFPDANDLDIRKASAAGDVCCICLNSMMVGGVKKVGCGHMFHTNCLREVVERERSIATAKCPLCRASLVTGRQDPPVVRPQGVNGLGNTLVVVQTGADARQAQPAQPANPQLNPGEQSLLRFSTENILPAWLPVPAFAFEVVRRETTAVVEPNPNPEGGWQRFFRRGGEVQVADANNDGNNQGNNEQAQPQEPQQPQRETSFWRRLLILVGAIPMSPEEEAMALEQLVDMFPQYDRADLLRELRSRRSAEAVAESILLGIFSGIPRGGGGVDVD
mmetsp:Transcript_17491/g.31743  ORF Transcript_17491/g.31743 Transcript_17491/m.31743 type:complete len:1020 (+) Transcript_17491:334-3393(+)|eukprot:CAMPEP_0201897824 /NCGR_PEP_ID=MMETSP0902-20130614/47352_1 /ASSEMBLY_ACC=CAM_ASM_000551 /TAXON_ID=420261 /ORGANISM="Thalassiosira antarctica, Strain CCMP982" /LENGTH=1019 /DNA_ID=CAMNT_0048430795 /DNA_START=285 /DNA_END=3344 /DNA_ORIENTATION=+